MTRTRRTTALFAAAVLALGATACNPPSENDSERTAPSTQVTPDSGYEGAGVATRSSESAEPSEESGDSAESGESGESAGTTQGEDGEPSTVGDTEGYAPGVQNSPAS